jgi:hypothetical protein
MRPMGYNIKLVGTDGNIVSVMKHQAGSEFAIGGTTDAEINITYNYSKYFREEIDTYNGIRWLYGKPAHECITILENAIEKLGTKKDSDYWKSTPGNAGNILHVLLGWAKQYPGAIFEGD